MTNNDLFDTLVVVKRSGQRTNFQGEKIAIAIQKAFNSIDIPYKDEDVNKIYAKVLEKIEKEYKMRKTINIENIQDIIELTLKEAKLNDVYEAFKNYRDKRNASRKTFVIKQQHKFLKAIEFLGLDNLNERKNEQPETVLKHFGNIISTEFAKAYLLDNKTSRCQDGGLIYIEALETMPMGEIASLEISFTDYIEANTKLKEKIVNSKNIEEYLSNIKIILFNLKKELYGSICLTNFDKDLSDITLNNYKEILLEYLKIYLKTSNLESFLPVTKIKEDIFNLKDLDDDCFYNYYKDNLNLKENFNNIREEARSKLEEILINSLNIFFKELVFLDISINFGTGMTKVLKLINKSIIKASINASNISYFFKIKNKVNKNVTDDNYEILEEYKNLNLERDNFNYSFLDTSFNNLKDEEVCYFSKGERVIEDNTTTIKKLVTGKGNIASCAINIVRSALKNSYLLNNEASIRGFYQELDKLINIAKEALLERFEIACTRKNTNFPYLYEEGLWHDGEKVKENDRLRKLLKHGNLTISFCGLKEAVYALEKDEAKHIELAKDIIRYMSKKIDNLGEDNNLNFVLSTVVSNDIKKEFKKQDTAIYGKLKNITDKDCYSDANMFSNDLKDISYLHKKCRGGALYSTKIKTKKELDNLILEASNNGIGAIHLYKD